MIKFVASDLDGTLLLDGAQALDDSIFEVIRQLHKQGVIFAAASGRQVHSLKMLFGPVAGQIMYIAENGALVEYKNQVIAKSPMDRQTALDIIEDVLSVPSCEVLVSGQHTAYMRPKTEEYYNRMRKVVKYHTTLVKDFADIEEDIIKISVCDLSGIRNSARHFEKNWADKTETAISGDLYLDFMSTGVSKGKAVRQIQESMQLKPEECMAFGDNFNDIKMLDQVGYPFVMEKADDQVKEHGKYETGRVEDSLRRIFHLDDH